MISTYKQIRIKLVVTSIWYQYFQRDFVEISKKVKEQYLTCIKYNFRLYFLLPSKLKNPNLQVGSLKIIFYQKGYSSSVPIAAEELSSNVKILPQNEPLSKNPISRKAIYQCILLKKFQ